MHTEPGSRGERSEGTLPFAGEQAVQLAVAESTTDHLCGLRMIFLFRVLLLFKILRKNEAFFFVSTKQVRLVPLSGSGSPLASGAGANHYAVGRHPEQVRTV